MESKKAILAIEAAIELFGQQGIDNTSTASIAKHAEMGTGTLFKYFKTKEELIKKAYLHSKLDLVTTLRENLDPSSPFEKLLRTLWLNYLQWAQQNPHKYRFNRQIKSSRFVDLETEETVSKEFLFFFVALRAALDQGLMAPVPLELAQGVILTFVNLAIEIHASHSGIHENQVYDLMLKCLSIERQLHI